MSYFTQCAWPTVILIAVRKLLSRTQCNLVYTYRSDLHTSFERGFCAKARLASGMSLGAREDLEAVLSIDPRHKEASDLLRLHFLDENETSRLSVTRGHERFPSEIWRDIITYLTRQDQRAMLFVPYISRIASQILFQNLEICFGVIGNTHDKSQVHQQDQRTAEIFTRIIQDPLFACIVKKIRILISADCIDFQAGMLANVIPNLINLRIVSLLARGPQLTLLLDALRPASQQLRTLNINCMDDDSGFRPSCSEFGHLTSLSLYAPRIIPYYYVLIAQNQQTLNSLSLFHLAWTSLSNILSIGNLTSLAFSGQFTDAQPFYDIFSGGHRLEFLDIRCFLDCNPSSQLKTLQTCLPCLTYFVSYFVFVIRGLGRNCRDFDLFPTLAGLLQSKRGLRTLQLSAPQAGWHSRVGFNTSAWRILNSLTDLVYIGMTYVEDFRPDPASWRLPQGSSRFSSRRSF